jgi:hypothetical protein
MGLIAGGFPPPPPSGIQVSPVWPICDVCFFALHAGRHAESTDAEETLENLRRVIIGLSLPLAAPYASQIAFYEFM